MLVYPLIDLGTNPKGNHVIHIKDVTNDFIHYRAVVGISKSMALLNAKTTFIYMMRKCYENNQLLPFPTPSPVEEGELFIELSESMSVRILLWNKIVEKQITRSKLAEILSYHPHQIKRLFDVDEVISVTTLQEAVKAIGCKLTITIT